jgi:hypothetical protein
VLGVSITTSSLLYYTFSRDKVEITGRERVLWTSNEELVSEESGWDSGIAISQSNVDSAKELTPKSLCPGDHPNFKAGKRVLKGLMEANGLDD